MAYSFAPIGAALGMAVEDVYTQNLRPWVRLREKGGKRHAMPCYLVAYLDGMGLRDDPKGPLFRTIGRGTGKLTRTRAASGERLCDDPPARGGGRQDQVKRLEYIWIAGALVIFNITLNGNRGAGNQM